LVTYIEATFYTRHKVRGMVLMAFFLFMAPGFSPVRGLEGLFLRDNDFLLQ